MDQEEQPNKHTWEYLADDLQKLKLLLQLLQNTQVDPPVSFKWYIHVKNDMIQIWFFIIINCTLIFEKFSM